LKSLIRIAAISCITMQTAACFAVEIAPGNLTLNGWGWLTAGRVEKSPTQSLSGDYDISFEKEVLTDFEMGAKLTAKVGNFSMARLHAGLGMYYLVYDNKKATGEFLSKKVVPFISDATFQSTFCVRGDRDTIRTEFGYFPVKYNPESRNLGEYLFRSGTYPGYLVTGYEMADKVKLCGVHGSYAFDSPVKVKADLYAFTEMESYPLHDLSFAVIASVSPQRKFVEFSAGVDFAHALSLDEKKITPALDTAVYDRYYGGDLRWVGHADSISGDTTLYTFRGTKVMARLTIDPKQFFPQVTIFGREDLKIYSEAAILGAKNYDGWYENIEERIPVMVGFNVPAFKLLDVLTLEVEWYGNKYWNAQEYVWKARSPVPYTGEIFPDEANWKPRTRDDLKWSVYASRKIGKHIRISGQIASDHLSRTRYTPGPPSFVKYTEICSDSNNWYWMIRTAFSF